MYKHVMNLFAKQNLFTLTATEELVVPNDDHAAILGAIPRSHPDLRELLSLCSICAWAYCPCNTRYFEANIYA